MTAALAAIVGIAAFALTRGSGERLSKINTLYEATDVSVFDVNSGHLNSLLVKRSPIDAGRRGVIEYLDAELQKLGYKTELDVFEHVSPRHGKLSYTNVIGTTAGAGSPPLEIVLGTHLDSKLIPGIDFVGATDAAAPMAIILDVAKHFSGLGSKGGPVALTVVFFDAEEPLDGNDKDLESYCMGSKHLSELWAKSGRINNLAALILIDVLGDSETYIPRFYEDDPWLYSVLLRGQEEMIRSGRYSAALEARLRKDPSDRYLERSSSRKTLIDDHVPFIEKGVSAVVAMVGYFDSNTESHHTASNNALILDPEVMRDISVLVKWAISRIIEDGS